MDMSRQMDDFESDDYSHFRTLENMQFNMLKNEHLGFPTWFLENSVAITGDGIHVYMNISACIVCMNTNFKVELYGII